jgi:hypothetical protein
VTIATIAYASNATFVIRKNQRIILNVASAGLKLACLKIMNSRLIVILMQLEMEGTSQRGSKVKLLMKR